MSVFQTDELMSNLKRTSAGPTVRRRDEYCKLCLTGSTWDSCFISNSSSGKFARPTLDQWDSGHLRNSGPCSYRWFKFNSEGVKSHKMSSAGVRDPGMWFHSSGLEFFFLFLLHDWQRKPGTYVFHSSISELLFRYLFSASCTRKVNPFPLLACYLRV